MLDRSRAVALTGGAVVSAMLGPAAVAEQAYYLAPEARGDGSGSSPANAAHYTSSGLWENVQGELQTQNVELTLLDGHYNSHTLWMDQIGHEDNRLTVQGESAQGVVFDGGQRWNIRLRGSQNITFRNLHFSGDVQNFAFHVGPYDDNGDVTASRNIRLEDSSFIDLNNARYGAIGISGQVDGVTVETSTFKRVGVDAHAHMVYNSHHPSNLRFIDNHFEDSTGDYLRVRDNIGHTEIRGNTFVSNSWERNRPFVANIVFNTEDPGTERLSDELVIVDNRFEFLEWHEQDWDRGIAIAFSSYGHDPEGVRYLLDPQQADTLENGTLEERRAILADVIGLNWETIEVHGNAYVNHFHEIAYGAFADHGAEDRGWEGFIDISDLAVVPEPGAMGVMLGVGAAAMLKRLVKNKRSW